MNSLRVPASDPLYSKLNAYLVHAAPRCLVASSRLDTKDPCSLRLTLDYGRFDIELTEKELSCTVDHRAPSREDGREASLTIISPSYKTNLQVLDLAIRAVVRSESDKTNITVFSWEGKWQQRQAAFVEDHTPTPSQQVVLQDAERFYGNQKFYTDRNLPYMRGVVLGGNTCSGKHWLVRRLAQEHGKSVCYFPITDHSYANVGPAMACAPLGTIVVLDNLPFFFSHVPQGEQGLFLRHLETVFNTPLHDPRGLLILAVTGMQTPKELDNFLLMPSRFQKRFEVSIAHKSCALAVLETHLTETDPEKIRRLASRCEKAQVPLPMLHWFFANLEMDQIEKDEELALRAAQEASGEVKDGESSPRPSSLAASPALSRSPSPTPGASTMASPIPSPSLHPHPDLTTGEMRIDILVEEKDGRQSPTPSSPQLSVVARLEALIQRVKEERAEVDAPLHGTRQRLYT